MAFYRHGVGESALQRWTHSSRPRQLQNWQKVQKGLRMDISITLRTPLGIVFEEAEPNSKRGVVVASLLPGGNAELDGRILVGDKVVSF